MRKLIGTVLIAVGALATFGGTVRLLQDLGGASNVLLWGGLAIVGLFVLGRGVITVMADGGENSGVNPEDAVGKTDSRFGHH